MRPGTGVQAMLKLAARGCRCEHCGSTETKVVGRANPTPEEPGLSVRDENQTRVEQAGSTNAQEQHFKANTVEVAQCSKCGGQTRFPRWASASVSLLPGS